MVRLSVPPCSTRLTAISVGVRSPIGWMNWYGAPASENARWPESSTCSSIAIDLPRYRKTEYPEPTTRVRPTVMSYCLSGGRGGTGVVGGRRQVAGGQVEGEGHRDVVQGVRRVVA